MHMALMDGKRHECVVLYLFIHSIQKKIEEVFIYFNGKDFRIECATEMQICV